MDLSFALEKLKKKKLGGIAVDVFHARQPLDSRSEWWSIENFIVSPYVGALYSDRVCDLEAFVEKQVASWLEKGVVDYAVTFP